MDTQSTKHPRRSNLTHHQFKRVDSATPLIASYKVANPNKEPEISKNIYTPRRVKDYNRRIYPAIEKKRQKVEELEKKLITDMERQFVGLDPEQGIVIKKIIDTTSAIRQIGNQHGGIGEARESELFNSIKRGSSVINAITTPNQGTIQLELFTDSGDICMKRSDSVTDEYLSNAIVDLEYPIFDPLLIGNEFLDSEANIELKSAANTNKAVKPMTLRQKYSKLIDPTRANIQSSQDKQTVIQSRLEQEAVTEMQRVSHDLQNWVTDVLDNSINLDSNILANIKELDKKYGQTEVPEKPKLETNIQGFDILLNACKPAILEAQPAMKLNVTREMEKHLGDPRLQKRNKIFDFPAGNQLLISEKKRNQYKSQWYLPPNEWASYQMKYNQSLYYSEKGRRKFGGVVQQKLDEIAKKRLIEEEYFMKEMEKMDLEMVKREKATSGDKKKR